jgi:hypothetical protein
MEVLPKSAIMISGLLLVNWRNVVFMLIKQTFRLAACIKVQGIGFSSTCGLIFNGTPEFFTF